MVIKYKSKLPLGPDGKPLDGRDLEFPGGHYPTRAEQQEQRFKDKEFGNYDNIKGYLKRGSGAMISQTEHLPQGDLQTYTQDEWQKPNEKSFNSRNNTYYSWH
jgi:hypothetical protein